MELSGHDRSKLEPFKYGDNYPPRAIYMRALSLVGSSVVVETFVEREFEEERSTITLWVLLPSSVIRISGTGPKDWETSQRTDPEDVSADLWPLQAISRISVESVESRTLTDGITAWIPRLRLVTTDGDVLLPSGVLNQTSFVGGSLDVFVSTLTKQLNG